MINMLDTYMHKKEEAKLVSYFLLGPTRLTCNVFSVSLG